MKKVFYGFLVCLAVMCVLAFTPTDRQFNFNQFGTNNFSISVKSGALTTNLSIRGAGHVIGDLNVDDTLTVGDFALDSGGAIIDAAGNATFQTISGDGSGISGLIFNGPFTNPVVYGSITNLPLSSADTTGFLRVFVPTTNSVAGQPKFQEWWTLDSQGTNRQYIFNRGYNVGPSGILNTNWHGWHETLEMNWDPQAASVPSNERQAEQYWTFYPRSNGTPYRIFSNTMQTGGGESRFNTDVFSLSDKTSNVPAVVVTLDLATHAATATLKGQLLVETNAQNNGLVGMLGGTVAWGVPTGFPGSTVSAGNDWNNGEGFRPDFYFKSTGTSKAWTTTGFTNLMFNRDSVIIHGANSRIQATNAHFANITNTSTTDAILVADANGKMQELVVGANLTYTAATRTLDASGSGSGDTNGMSYLPDMQAAAKVRNLAGGSPVFELLYTNGVQALGITNTGSDTDGFAIRSSTGMEAFRFTADGDLRIASPGAFYGYANDSVGWGDFQLNQRWLLDTNGTLVIDFTDATAGVNITTLNPTTVNTAAINLGENSGAIALDAALSADGKSAGITRAGTAGATLAFGDLIVLDPTDSRWELADANSASGADGDARGMIGVCVLAAAADGDPTVVLLQGVVRADAVFPSFTVNAPIYVSETAGDITATSPTTEDNVVRILGVATTADEIYFDPDRVWTVYVP